MATGLDAGLSAKKGIIGVMEPNEERGRPDFAEEKRRCCEVNADGYIISDRAKDIVHLLDEVCFVPYERQKHLVDAMLSEILRQAGFPTSQYKGDLEPPAQEEAAERLDMVITIQPEAVAIPRDEEFSHTHKLQEIQASLSTGIPP